MISIGCTPSSEAAPGGAPALPPPGAAATVAAPVSPPSPEAALGVADTGIWSDLDGQVQLALPAVAPARVAAQLDRPRGVLVVSIDGAPRKVYPLGGPAALTVGPHVLALRPGDRAELAPVLDAARLTTGRATPDADGDGVPDPLDVLLGARKAALNADAYTEGYVALPYPQGDVPRTMGVCTDVVIRAVRNAGIDLQRALHEDIRRAPRAYPMVRGRGNASIDHRRVATLLPYFRRHWQERSPRVDDPADPLWPGDVVFMDTMPRRSGPDHIGVISDRLTPAGAPLVINNWTNGTVTTDMDLLGFVPVVHRFRLVDAAPRGGSTRPDPATRAAGGSANGGSLTDQ